MRDFHLCIEVIENVTNIFFYQIKNLTSVSVLSKLLHITQMTKHFSFRIKLDSYLLDNDLT